MEAGRPFNLCEKSGCCQTSEKNTLSSIFYIGLAELKIPHLVNTGSNAIKVPSTNTKHSLVI